MTRSIILEGKIRPEWRKSHSFFEQAGKPRDEEKLSQETSKLVRRLIESAIKNQKYGKKGKTIEEEKDKIYWKMVKNLK